MEPLDLARVGSRHNLISTFSASFGVYQIQSTRLNVQVGCRCVRVALHSSGCEFTSLADVYSSNSSVINSTPRTELRRIAL